MFSRFYGVVSIGFIETLNFVAINSFVITLLQLVIAVLTILKLSIELKKFKYNGDNKKSL